MNHFSTIDENFVPIRIRLGPRSKREPTDARNGGKSLPPESEGLNLVKIARLLYLAGGMTLEGKEGFIGIHSAAVVFRAK